MLGSRIADLDTIQQHVGRGRMLGLVPVGSSHTFIFWLLTRAEAKAAAQRPFAQLKQEIVQFAPFTQAALRGIRSWDDVSTVCVSLTRAERWVRGTVALMGDAVHATTPSLAQGANMALCDAVSLGTALARWNANGGRSEVVEPYLLAYQRARRGQANRQHFLGKLLARSSTSRHRWVQTSKLLSLGALTVLPAGERLLLRALCGPLS